MCNANLEDLPIPHECDNDDEGYVAEVHVHMLPIAEKREQHSFVDNCHCQPLLEIQQDEDENEVLFIYHNVVH